MVKRKYNLPKYICFDVRTTLCRKKPTYDITLVSNDNKAHSTKTLSVYEGVMAVIKNRIQYKGWTNDDVATYLDTYTHTMEGQYTLQDACNIAGVTLDSVTSGAYMKERYSTKIINPIVSNDNIEEDCEQEKTEISNITQDKSFDIEKRERAEYLNYLRKNPQWFNIANFPDYQIYSEPYLYTNEYDYTCTTYRIRNLITKKEIKPHTKSNSLYVSLHGVNKAVYKLAADTFLHNPNKARDSKLIATEVHHLDGNHSNNRLENLEHVTKEVHALFHKQLNANKIRHKLTLDEILKIKAANDVYGSYYKVAQNLGYNYHQVKAACIKTDKQIQKLREKELKLAS